MSRDGPFTNRKPQICRVQRVWSITDLDHDSGAEFQSRRHLAPFSFITEDVEHPATDVFEFSEPDEFRSLAGEPVGVWRERGVGHDYSGIEGVPGHYAREVAHGSR